MTHSDQKAGVVLLGENDLLREGLRRIIETNGFEVCAAEKNLSVLLRECGELLDQKIDLFVMDCGDAHVCIDADISTLHQLLPEARILVLHDTFDLEYMIAAFQAGVDGYVVKSITSDSLIECLRLVAMGEKVMPSALANLLPEWGRRTPQAEPADAMIGLLSSRELETLRCLSRGDPNKVIARELAISEATVKVHVKAILRKLGLSNRTQAAAWTLNAGRSLVESDVWVGAGAGENGRAPSGGPHAIAA